MKTEGGNGDGTEDPGRNHLLTSVEDIDDFNEKISSLLKPHIIRTGSIFKIDSEALINWGVGITKENLEALKERYEFFHGKDYKERRENEEIEFVLRTEYKTSIEARMAEFIGVAVKELLKARDDGKQRFRICDVPARDGKLSASIADALRRDPTTTDLLERTSFFLLDASDEKIKKAKAAVGQYGIHSIGIVAQDERYFDNTAEQFDMIVSLSHFHHKPFLLDYLVKLHNALADDGTLLAGDWHSSLCSRPANILKLFRNIGLDPGGQEQFQMLLGDRVEDHRKELSQEEINKLLADKEQLRDSEEESRALAEHIMHWKRISEKVKQTNFEKKPRLYIFSAHDTSKQREKKLERAGFTVESDRIKAAFPKDKLPEFSRKDRAVKSFVNGSDSAVVMIAGKRR